MGVGVPSGRCLVFFFLKPEVEREKREWDFGWSWSEKVSNYTKRKGGGQDLHTQTHKNELQMFAKTVLGDCSPIAVEIGAV